MEEQMALSNITRRTALALTASIAGLALAGSASAQA
jgi:hypothetical protein